MPISATTQLKAVLRKNWILQKRNSRDLCREIFWPVLLLGALVAIKLSVKNQVHDVKLAYDSDQVAMRVAELSLPDRLSSATQVLFAPSDDPSVASVAAEFSAQFPGVTHAFKKTGADLEAAYLASPDTVLAGVVFPDPSVLASGGTGDVPYVLRVDAKEFLSGVGQDNVTTWWDTLPSTLPQQYENMFLPVQRALEAAIITVRSGGSAVPTAADLSFLAIQEGPTDAWTLNLATQVLGGILPLYLVIIFSVNMRVLIASVLMEKEKKLKEGMRMMGLSDGVFWGSWALTAAVKNGTTAILITIVSKVGKLFEYSDPTVLLVFFLIFTLNCIVFGFMLTTLFSSARTGGAVGMLGFILLSTPIYALKKASVSGTLQTWSCLLSPVAFSFGTSILNFAEDGKVGVHWSNLNKTDFDDTISVSLGTVMYMLLVDIGLNALLLLYLDKVVPNDYGTTLKPWFFLQPSYWSGKPASDADSERKSLLGAGDVESGAVAMEPVPADVSSRGGVAITGLTKTFPTEEGPKTAVDRLSLNMFEGHITALLGHNGAGKTTTISMLTGLFSPTSGDAAVYGKSIVNDIGGARDAVGVCPQHDVQFDQLTVREHLELFAGIKGMALDAAGRAHVDKLIADVGLEEKRDVLSKALSGGQRRRLSVAMAFVGSPKVVFLDECTSGLDPGARRQIWTLLEREKAGRVIVLTTHFMGEAEILSDRIAIMAKGRLQVVGSPLFLKGKFGIGYHLVLAADTAVDSESITQLIKHHIPSAAMEDETVAGEMSFVLPLEAVGTFPALFEDLDAQREAMGINSYGISMTSLEEVFLRLAHKLEEEEAKADTEAADKKSGGGGAGGADDGMSSDKRLRSSSLALDVTDLGRRRGGAAAGAAAQQGDSTGTGQESKDTGLASGASESKMESMSVSTDHDGGYGAGAGRSSTGTSRDRYASILASVSLASSSAATFWQQVKAQFWRRAKQATRDKKGLWLQCFFPLMFVGISFTFRSLSKISALTPLISFALTSGQYGSLSTSVTLPYVVSPTILPTGTTTTSTSASPSVVGSWSSDVSAVLADSYPSEEPSAPHAFPAANASYTALEQFMLDTGYTAGALVFEPTHSSSNSSFGLTLLYNTSFVNGPAILLSMYDSAVLRHTGGDGAKTDSFVPTFDPFPRTPAEQKSTLGDYLANAFGGLYLALGFCSIPALMAFNVVKEREVKAKQQQLIMGMSVPSYWVSTWMWDSAQFLVPWIGASILVLVLGGDGYKGTNFVAVFLLLGCYGAAVPGLAYVLSFMFKTSAMAQTGIMGGFSIFTLATFIINFMLELPTLGLPSIAGDLSRYVFMLFPNFCLSKGFLDVGLKAACPSTVTDCDAPSPFGWSIILQKYVFLLLSIPLWLGVIVYLERKAASDDGFGDHVERKAPVVTEDRDVHNERDRIEGGGPGLDDQVVARSLRKVYPSDPEPKVAVAGVTFGVKPGEVMGVLGPNGAGKTTTMSMLTGEVPPTAGTATICGAGLQQDRSAVYSAMGYCPQFDALFDLLTGEEVLTFYARVKGVPANLIPELVDVSLRKMDLMKYKNQLTSTYSGGNKRKLSLAVAYIGAPRVVFLDEPSTGMDPVARRHMWGVVQAMRPGRSVILTSHLLDEVDFLSSRIAIMVKGRMACIGTSQHLKSTYGTGYQLEVKTSNLAKADAVQDLVKRISETAVLDEAHQGHFKFTLSQSVRLADTFRLFEENKEALEIEDYSVSQTTLEQVFLRFSRMQEAADHAEAEAAAAARRLKQP